jgi:hypothetical protein
MSLFLKHIYYDIIYLLRIIQSLKISNRQKTLIFAYRQKNSQINDTLN